MGSGEVYGSRAEEEKRVVFGEGRKRDWSVGSLLYRERRVGDIKKCTDNDCSWVIPDRKLRSQSHKVEEIS